MISPRDRQILRALARFRFLPTSLICECIKGDSGANTVRVQVSLRLKHLQELGLVQRLKTLGREYVYYLSQEGAEVMHTEGGKAVGVRLGEYSHDLALARLCVALEKDWGKTLLTERQCRAVDLDPTVNDYALKVVRANGNVGWAWPDLVAEENGVRIGYEVEWTRKNKRRLLLLMHAYGYALNYDMAVYFTNPDTHQFVSQCAEEANAQLELRGKGRPIAVRPLSKYIALPESLT